MGQKRADRIFVNTSGANNDPKSIKIILYRGKGRAGDAEDIKSVREFPGLDGPTPGEAMNYLKKICGPGIEEELHSPDTGASSTKIDTVSVLLGNGDGALRTAVTYPVGAAPHSLLAADFSGDGKPDLVTLNGDSKNLSVLLSKGDGNFQAAVTSPRGISRDGSGYMGYADFNRDGKPDLLIAYKQ